MANDNEYSDKVWFMASYHFALLCLYTESQYVPVRHTVENGYMFITFFHPSTACLRVMSRVYSVVIFLSFTLFDWLRARNQIRLCIYSISPHFLDALSSGHIALLFFNSSQGKHAFEIILPHYCLPSFTNSSPKSICTAWSLPLLLMKKAKFNSKLRNLPLAACWAQTFRVPNLSINSVS